MKTLRFLGMGLLTLMVSAGMTSCDKDDDPNTFDGVVKGLLIGDAKDEVTTVNAHFTTPNGEDSEVVASAAATNGRFSLMLPTPTDLALGTVANIQEQLGLLSELGLNTTEIVADFKSEPEQFKSTGVSFTGVGSNDKAEALVTLINDQGATSLLAMSLVTYLYVDRDVKMTGKFASEIPMDMMRIKFSLTADIQAKKGWNCLLATTAVDIATMSFVLTIKSEAVSKEYYWQYATDMEGRFDGIPLPD